MEKWEHVAAYEGKYEVSDLGRVRSLDRKTEHKKYVAYRKGKIMSQSSDQDGYKLVKLSNGKGKMFKVHRLIAMAFISNPYDYPIINHKDNDPSNNTIENLEWCTHQMNIAHMRAQNRKGEHPHQKKIEQWTVEGKLVRVWDGIRVAMRETGVNNIQAVLYGTQNVSGGYVWRYHSKG